MAKPSLANITTAQTFQNWFDKTNELVDLFKNEAITAALPGDTTNGNATLNGIFTATNVVASTLLQSDDIASRTPSGTITFQSPIELVGTSQIVATFNYGAAGAQTRYTNGSLSWDVGIESSTPGNFVIDTGVAPTKFQLSTAGTLTVPNVIALEDIVADEFRLSDGTVIGGGATTLDDLTNVTITSPSAGQVLKYNGSAWVNGTDATDGGTATDADTLDGLNSTQFIRSDANDSASGDYNFSGEITLSKSSGIALIVGADAEVGGNLLVGEVRASGDVITAYSASDLALKENLQLINNALDKVSQVNGYTFNYVDKPEERVAGIVAQEIEKVLPEVVFDHERNNGTYKAVRYDNVIPLLIEAIKELKGKVNDLENRLSGSGN
jgi:hypothetical protein